jgi:hypothetical protein
MPIPAAAQEPQLASQPNDIEGTFRINSPARRVRAYELVALDPANQAELQAQLLNRLNGRVDGRVEASWLDPYRSPGGTFRMFYLISWEL